MTQPATSDSTKAPPSKWPERLWIFAAVILLAVGVSLFGVQRIVRSFTGDGITHEIMPGLQSADRIAAAAGDLRDFNVVIITTDTTRADHIGCYGNQSVQTPTIDGLAREGILCAQAVTPSPSTLPAHSSLMTGLYPVHHGARANGTFRLEDKVTTLAERLKAKGYRTGAVISAFVLDSRFGLDQGFDLYHDDLTKGMKYSAHMFRERAAELTNEPASAWLRENAKEKFFLWVHYFDPHAVHMPPEPFRTRYQHDLYDGEISYADSQIGVLLSQLEELGVRDKTLIIYTSDHGEGFGEHGEQTHSLLVYDSTLHVPMIIHAPAILPQGKVLERQACLVDVVPTVLSLLGEEVPEDLDGVNLCEPPQAEPRPVLIETIATMTLHGWAPLLGVRRNDYKYIFAPTPELYDLRTDPRELDNLHENEPEVVKQLSGTLTEWLGDEPLPAVREAVASSSVELDADARQRLADLGYLSTVDESQEPAEALGDPKEMIVSWELVQKAIHLTAEGNAKDAIPILEKCIADAPRDVFSRSILANAYRQMGELDRAMMHFERAVEDEPKSVTARMSIAGLHMAAQELEKAEKKIDEALAIDEHNASAYLMRGQIAHSRRQEKKALEFYEKALEMDPGSSGSAAHNQIGYLHLMAGRLDEARAAFRSAIRIDALNGSAHDGLANILKQEGKVEAAMKELKIALRFNPNQPRALSTLASLISQQGDQELALKHCNRVLEMAPKYGPGHSNLGLIYRRQNKLDLAEKHYKLAVQYDPRLVPALVNLAQLYVRQGKTEEAIEQFRKAVQANPQYPNPIALANLGAHHYNNGRYQRAYNLYRRALHVDPDYALVHKHIATIYALPQWDRPDLAVYHLRRSLDLDPQQADVGQLRQLLALAEKTMAGRTGEPAPPGPQDPEPPGAEPPGAESPDGTAPAPQPSEPAPSAAPIEAESRDVPKS